MPMVIPLELPDGHKLFLVQGLDPVTGEPRAVLQMRRPKKRVLRYTDQYVRVFAPGWAALRGARLNGSEARLFFALMELAGGELQWAATPRELEPMLGWDPNRISRVLGTLVAKGLVVRVRPGLIAHDPLLSWSSDVGSRETAKHRITHPEFYEEEDMQWRYNNVDPEVDET